MTKADKILIVLVLILGFSSFFFMSQRNLSSGQLYASIQVNGTVLKRIVLDESLAKTQYPIQTDYGYNLVEVEGLEIRVIEADCPDKLDVKQGSIRYPGEVIVCLPNRLVIEITDESNEEIDMVNH